MVSETGPRVVRSNSSKGPVYLEKGQKRAKWPNENFCASKCCLGPNFLNLAPKGPAWKPWCMLRGGERGGRRQAEPRTCPFSEISWYLIPHLPFAMAIFGAPFCDSASGP